jgi:hypothetical protein
VGLWHLSLLRSGYSACLILRAALGISEVTNLMTRFSFVPLYQGWRVVVTGYLAPILTDFIRSWLRYCATSRKVEGSISDDIIGFFNWPNLSSRPMALGWVQSLTEMSTMNLAGGKGQPGSWRVRLTTSPETVSLLSIKCGSLDV